MTMYYPRACYTLSMEDTPLFVRVHPWTGEWQGADDGDGPWYVISEPPPSWRPSDNGRPSRDDHPLFPDGPVAFLADCAHWWAWLQQADPDEITRYPENGHLHYSLPPRFP